MFSPKVAPGEIFMVSKGMDLLSHTKPSSLTPFQRVTEGGLEQELEVDEIPKPQKVSITPQTTSWV